MNNKGNYYNNNYNRKNNYNKNNYESFDYKLRTLQIKEGDVLLIECGNNRIPTSDIKFLADKVKDKVGKDIAIVISPKDININTIEEEQLTNIIDRLIEIRDNKWKNKLK